MSDRIETRLYLDQLEPYLLILESALGMEVLREKPRELRVTDGITSCTIQFPAYLDGKQDLRPTLQQAAQNVKDQTLKLQEKYDC